MARRRAATAAPAPVLAPAVEREVRRRGRDRVVLLCSLCCALIMFALALLHAGGH
ncbi:MAG: hypothetical protein INR65_04325 [Gluconacetobacter diazotrophicus]|nr:hypothetical protein [Gluconacetobacter diazotrophicus]